MADTLSFAERAEMPFKERRKRERALLYYWTVFHQIPAKYQEKKVQFKNKIFAAFSDPLQINLERLLVDANTFEEFLQRVRAMYGSDVA